MGRHLTVTVGLVDGRTRVANGYRIVLAPAKSRKDGSWIVLPGRATSTRYLVPRSFVPQASLLSGAIQVTADGHRVAAVKILG